MQKRLNGFAISLVSQQLPPAWTPVTGNQLALPYDDAATIANAFDIPVDFLGLGPGVYSNAMDMQREFALIYNDDLQRYYESWLHKYVTEVIYGDATDQEVGPGN